LVVLLLHLIPFAAMVASTKVCVCS